MPNRPSNKSIPVPCDQPSRRGAANRDGQQPQWRSSLDLVWSYSRSQAFYGDNIATSPSFVERHWAGKDLEEEGDSVSEGDEEYISDDEERETDLESLDNDQPPFERPEWEGETLPPNAVGKRDKGRARDRRLDRIESEDDRSRSRSRSPKRLGGASKHPHRASMLSNGESHLKHQASATGSSLRDPFADEDEITEATPLVGGRSTSRHRSAGYSSIRRLSGSKSSAIYGQGTSTFLQSWFNTVNALVGVGILALPLAFSYAGWIGGVVLFLICGLLTNYTGKVLARIMWKEPSLRTYADIGSYAFGPSARLLVSLFFCLELWAVSVALIILFGDSLAAIFPSVPAAAFKAIGFALVLPTVFLPLKLLSPISVIGIFSTLTLVVVVVSDGLIKQTAPGSLRHPAPSTLGPKWSHVPLSFGLIMSGFSSHPVIPSLVKDMKDPRLFPRMLNLAYVAATIIYLTMGMVGYAMFGTSVSDEITKDLARTPGLPRILTKIAIWLIVINPLSKFALATRPVQTTFEILFGIEAALPAVRSASGVIIKPPQPPATKKTSPDSSQQHVTFEGAESENPLAGSSISLRAAKVTSGLSPRTKAVLRIVLRIVLTALITVTAILLPGFEKVMAFLGAFLAFTTCVFGPLIANLKLFGGDMKRWRIGVDIFILAISAVMATTGTVWAFLPVAKQ